MTKKKDTLTTREALVLLEKEGYKISLTTVITWVRINNLGYKMGGRWYLNKIKFLQFIAGKTKIKKEAETICKI